MKEFHLTLNHRQRNNLLNEEGETPLHYAAYYGKDILIPYLLYLHPKAAEMKTFTMEYTPLDLARSVSNLSLIHI